MRDVCRGHPVNACPFHGLFARDLTVAHWRAANPAGEQLALDTTEAAA